MLHSLRSSAEKKAADRTCARRTSPAAKEVPPADTVLALEVDRVLDFLGLSDNVGVQDVFGLQVCDDLLGFLDLSMGNEPSGGFWQPRNRCIEDEDEDELEREWESPGDGAVDEGEAIGDPIAEGETGDVQYQLDDNELPSPRGGGSFSLPDGSSGSVHAISQTSDDAARNHLGHAEGRNLQDGADGHDGGTNEDRVAATETLAEGEGGDGAKEAANVVDGGDGGEHGGVFGAGEVERVEEVLGDDYATCGGLAC